MTTKVFQSKRCSRKAQPGMNLEQVQYAKTQMEGIERELNGFVRCEHCGQFKREESMRYVVLLYPHWIPRKCAGPFCPNCTGFGMEIAGRLNEEYRGNAYTLNPTALMYKKRGG